MSSSSEDESTSSSEEEENTYERRKRRHRSSRRNGSPQRKRMRLDNRRKKSKPNLQMKYKPPSWSTIPNSSQRWCLQVSKKLNKVALCPLFQRASFTTFGRHKDNDFPVLHESLSRLHSVIQYGKERVWLWDCSANGTKVNGRKVSKEEYVQLKIGDTIKFASSTREYILKPDETVPILPSIAPQIPYVEPKPAEDWETALQATEVITNATIDGARRDLLDSLKNMHTANPENTGSIAGYRDRMKKRSFQVYTNNR